MAATPEVNFRQIGRRIDGQLAKGGKHTHASRTAASIPSKFETTLVSNSHETDGFGARTYRFSSAERHVPGPGHYKPPPPQLVKTGAAVSKRGYLSGFASKSTRFSDRQFLHDSSAPGPGSYSQVDKHRVHAYDPRKSACTAVFASPKPASPSRYPTPPGPGEYELDPRRTRRAKAEKSRKSATFQSKVARFKPLGAAEKLATPAVGKYETAKAKGYLDRQGEVPLPLSTLRSDTQRGTDTVYDRHMLKTPAPGTYEAPQAWDSTKVELHKRNQHRCVFANVNVDRFGDPYEKKTDFGESPGPGWYALEQRPESRAQSMPTPSLVRSPFQSGVRRFDAERAVHDRAPGPAFYHPAVSTKAKKSFLLNTTNKWV